jgi:hypothetical protein
VGWGTVLIFVFSATVLATEPDILRDPGLMGAYVFAVALLTGIPIVLHVAKRSDLKLVVWIVKALMLITFIAYARRPSHFRDAFPLADFFLLCMFIVDCMVTTLVTLALCAMACG